MAAERERIKNESVFISAKLSAKKESVYSEGIIIMVEICIEEDGSAELLLDSRSLDSMIGLCGDIGSDGKKVLNIGGVLCPSAKSIKILFDENLSKYTFSIYLKENVFHIELDKEGMKVFLAHLNDLKKEALEKGRSHCHFMTAQWAGNELTMPACREAVSVNMLTVHVST